MTSTPESTGNHPPLINFSRGVLIDFASGETFGNDLLLSSPDTVSPWAIHQIVNLAKSRSPYVLRGSEPFLHLPSHLSLDPHQLESVGYIIAGDDTLLGDDAGLGKTISMIVSANVWDCRKILIVCPAVVKYNWKAELTKWWKWGKILPIHVTEGDDIGRIPDTGGVTIINYDLLVRHKKVLDSITWDLAIFDESHRLSNPEAKRTRAALGHGKRTKPIPAHKRIFASATAMNRPKNLWTMAQTCDPKGLGANWFKFHMRYCNGFRTPYGWDVNGASNLPELGARMRKAFYVRHDDSVLKLHPYTESTIAIPRSDEVNVLQRNIILDILGKAKDTNDTATLDRLGGLIKAIESSPNNLDVIQGEFDNAVRIVGETLAEQTASLRGLTPSFEFMSLYRKAVGLAKCEFAIRYVKDWLENTDDPDEPLIIFAHHKETVAALYDSLSKVTSCEIIDGSVAPIDRETLKNDFQAGKFRVFILNLAAGGEGITLTRANTVLMVETDWQASTIRQAFKRAHRRGQTRPVSVVFIVMDDSIDVAVTHTFLSKRAVINEINDEMISP